MKNMHFKRKKRIREFIITMSLLESGRVWRSESRCGKALASLFYFFSLLKDRIFFSIIERLIYKGARERVKLNYCWSLLGTVRINVKEDAFSNVASGKSSKKKKKKSNHWLAFHWLRLTKMKLELVGKCCCKIKLMLTELLQRIFWEINPNKFLCMHIWFSMLKTTWL